MTRTLIAAALAGSALLASPAFAQTLAPAVVAVVDLDRIYRDCNACKTANAQLESQARAIRTRSETLGKQLETEGKAIQAAASALGGKQPDAALTARVRTFQTRQTQAQTEISGREQTFQRNRAHVLEQINTKLDPLMTQVMTRRGANVMLEAGSTLRINRAIDVTADVLTALNASLTSLSTTAPAAAKPAAPSGR